jgi:hypothetical protein
MWKLTLGYDNRILFIQLEKPIAQMTQSFDYMMILRLILGLA